MLRELRKSRRTCRDRRGCKGETAALNTDVRNTAGQFTRTIPKNCFVLFIVGSLGLLRLWLHCLKPILCPARWRIHSTQLHTACTTLLPPSSLILCPLPLPELRRKLGFLTLSPILSRNIHIIYLNLLSAESIEEARLGWCRTSVVFIKLIYNDYMWLASRVCIAQPPAAALHGCLRKSWGQVHAIASTSTLFQHRTSLSLGLPESDLVYVYLMSA